MSEKKLQKIGNCGWYLSEESRILDSSEMMPWKNPPYIDKKPHKTTRYREIKKDEKN
jgi:hypothetical protein